MKFISNKKVEPFMLIGMKGRIHDEFIVRYVPANKASCALCGVDAEWIMISEDATEEQRLDVICHLSPSAES